MKLCVLLIEDDPVQSRLVSRVLENDGFKVRSAESASQALGMIRKERPDLVLSDVSLPGIDGAQAISLMKKDPDLSSVPMILTSTMPEEELRIKRAESEADDVLPKPFNTEDLVPLIRYWTSRSR